MRKLYVLLAILFAGLLLFASGFTIPPYGDDFLVYFPPFSFDVWTPFVTDNPQTGFYRPIANAYLVLVQSAVGLSSWPVHVTHWLLHSLVCFIVYLGAVKLGFSRIQAGFGTAFMLAAQANAHPVLSYDTISQVLACLFGYLSVYALIVTNEKRLQGNASGRGSTYVLSLVAYTLALFSKETGVGFFFVVGTYLLAAEHGRSGVRITERIRWALPRFVPYLLILIVFVAIRSRIASMQPVFGDDPVYGFRLGFNMVKNLAMLTFAALTPVSTTDVFVALSEQGIGLKTVLFAAATIVFVLAVGYGLWRSGSRVRLMVVAAAAIVSLAPVYPLNKVSELYAYTAMPIVSLLVGIGLGGLFTQARGSRFRVLIAATLVVALLVSNVWSVQRKTAQMKASADKAQIVLDEVVRYARQVPDNGALVILDRPVPGEVYYSVFLMHGMQLVRWARPLIKYISGRDDITVHRILDGIEEPPIRSGPTLVLEICEDGIHVCRADE